MASQYYTCRLSMCVVVGALRVCDVLALRDLIVQ